MNTSKKWITVLVAAGALTGTIYANWSDSFDGGALGLNWEFLAFPQVTGTFEQTMVPGDEGNHYMVFRETVTSSEGGAAFGAGFGGDETFRDVRVGAVVNVAGDASQNYYGLLARGSYIMDTDGSLSGIAPGVLANCYIMHINYDDGPANLRIDLEKVVTNQNIMDEDIEAVIPRVGNARSYYAELDVVGSDPVYVTGSLYEYKGGPLVAQTPVMVDTNGNDWWEDADEHDAVFTEGLSGIFAQNEAEEPVGFHVTWDDISSVSDGPAAVLLGPADGQTGVSIAPTLSWVEAEFATGRDLWFGPAGALQPVDPAPEGASFTLGLLEMNRKYQWRVDQVGPAGVVQGHTWEFTTRNGLTVDDFESYADNEAIAAAWVHNIPGEFDYVFLDTGTRYQGSKALRLEYQNQFEPYLTEAARTFEEPQDWTVMGLNSLTLRFRGQDDNMEQQLYLRVEDAAGNQATVEHAFVYAVQSEPWRAWAQIDFAQFTDAGVDVTAVKKLAIGVGNGTPVEDEPDGYDEIYIDDIALTIN